MVVAHLVIVYVLFGISIQDVVLKEEDDVKDDSDVAQTKLDRVPSYASPVVLQSRVDDQLC